MRINELLTESELLGEITRRYDIDSATTFLMLRGYRKIGSGYYATVLEKPGESFVLKLFESADAGYREFINLANETPNTHFPNFKGKMMQIADAYYAIRMEKLAKLEQGPGPGWDNTGDLCDALSGYARALLTQRKTGQVVNPNMDIVREYMHDDPAEYGPALAKLEKQQPGILDAVRQIMYNVKHSRHVDLHPGNMMMRGNVLVITDPVAF